ncbi:MAG: PAS domain-containing protein, partial [Planctomycetia bacterium]
LIRSCNRVDEGFTREQVVGHSIVRFTVDDSSARVLKALGEVFGTGEPRALETTVRRLTGDYNYFSLRLMPLRHDGRTVAVLACCESTLPLKTTELHLRRE